MTRKQKHCKILPIGLICLIIGIFAMADLSADEVFSLRKLTIVGETSLNQFTNYAPQFRWEYSHPAEDYLLKMRLVSDDLTADSLVWDSGPLTTTENGFRFSGLGVFEKGRTYHFYVAAKHPERGWSDSLRVTFTFNTPPAVPEILMPADTVFLDKKMQFKITPATDRQINAEDLHYQIRLSSDSAGRQIVLDTTFQGGRAAAQAIVFITEKSLIDNRRYYIVIRAYDGVEYSAWSPSVGFLVNRINEPPRRFSPTAPVDGITVKAPPLLAWEKTTDPDDGLGTGLKEYFIEVATDRSFQNPESAQILPSTSNEWTFQNCRNHVRYFWRVTARDEAGAMTAADKVFSFVSDFGNQPPAPPVAPSPQNGQIVQPSDYLEWTLGDDPDQDQRFACEIIMWEITDPAKQITVYLTDSLLEQARGGRSDELSREYNGRVRFRLNGIKNLQALKDDLVYRWSVRVFDNWGGKTEASWPEATFRFDDGINQPPLPPVKDFSPNNTVISSYTPELKWAPATDPDVADRLRYQVVLSRDSGFSGRTFITEESAYDNNEIKIRIPLLENRQYFWRVRSIDLSETRSAWSRTNSFWVNNINEAPARPVKILRPQNLEEITLETIFWWMPSADPDPGDQLFYQIEFSENISFVKPLVSYRIPETLSARQTVTKPPLPPESIGLRTYSIPQINLLKDNALYYCRILAFDQIGMAGTSASAPLRIAFNNQNDPPLQIARGFSPTDGAIINTLRPEMRWEASSDPDFGDYQPNLTYQIELSNQSGFTGYDTRTYNSAAGQTTFTLPTDLTENQRWFYRIRACDQHGTYSVWSPINNFITNAISEAPYTITAGFLPKDSMVVETPRPLISWLPSGDPDPGQSERDLYYLVRYYEAENPKRASQVASKIGLTSVQLPELKENKYYRYQIAAVDPDGKRSEWSASVYFGINAVEQAPDYFKLLSPYFGQDSVGMDAGFVWFMTHDKDPGSSLTYTLHYATDSLFNTNCREIVLNQPENDSIMVYFPPEQLSYATRYFWNVVATDNSGNTKWASGTETRPFVFTTIGARRVNDGGIKSYHRHQNYPNPFNFDTLIRYEVPSYSSVDVSIYDLIGEKIRTLADGNHTQGIYNIYWNGTDQSGSSVANGVYICRLTAHGATTYIKVVLLR
ncbi:MAG: FlgD immunoglobulin-like domain containing protein [Candidatus Neomarinimicrobiota bacterium]